MTIVIEDSTLVYNTVRIQEKRTYQRHKGMKRPTWDEYFLNIAREASKRSTCLRRQSGAVLVTRDKWVVSIGYNGAPAGLPHCSELGGCLREQLKIPSGQRAEICRAVHAEQNAILIAARDGRSTKGTTLYSTTFPCLICTKMLIQAGVIEVVYSEEYDDQETMKMFRQAGIIVRRLL